MVTLEQYPHFLYVLLELPASQTESGAWVQGESEWLFITKCRFEPSGGGLVEGVDGGGAYRTNGMIYAPVGIQKITEGSNIVVSRQELTESLTKATINDGIRNGDFLFEGRCQKCDVGRLHSRLWV